VSGKATRSLGVWQGSAAQQAEEMVPDGVTVVAALHTVSAPTLADLTAELDEDVLLCGDRKVDKAKVARLIEAIPGLRAVNAWPLEMARIVEQLTPMLISINARYKTHAGIRILGLPDDGSLGGRSLLPADRRSEARRRAPGRGRRDLSVIANTGDDVEAHGLLVSPDPDLCTYWLTGQIDERARLGHPRRHVHRPRPPRAAGRARLVLALRPRPGDVPVSHSLHRRGRHDRPRPRPRSPGARRRTPRCCRCPRIACAPGC
jgi:hypothetical protein